MPIEKAFICLANSYREGGRCIAGKEILLDYKEKGGYTCIDSWIRPVGSETSSLNASYSTFKTGDIIHCLIDGKEYDDIQSENFIISEDSVLTSTHQIDKKSLPNLLDSPTELWAAGASSYAALNNRVYKDILKNNKNSLFFIEVEKHEIIKTIPYDEFSRSKMLVSFVYKDVQYSLQATCSVSNYWQTLKEGERISVENNAYITISLTKPFSDNYCYKLVASYETV